MTRDGNVAQLIVKKRDPKTKPSTSAETGLHSQNHFPRSIYATSWIPVSSVYLQPNLIRLDTFAVKNSSDYKPLKHISNVIDTDR